MPLCFPVLSCGSSPRLGQIDLEFGCVDLVLQSFLLLFPVDLFMEDVPVAGIDAGFFELAEHVVVFVVLKKDDFEHVVEERIFFVRPCDSGSWLQIAASILNVVGHCLRDDLLSERDQGLTTGSMELVFKVTESSS